MTNDSKARLFVRIDFGDAQAFGPGKARLLELVDEHGSIARAAAAMNMSYAHAWKLLDAAEVTFGTPLIVTATGGAKGGGATLTPQGRAVLERYRDIERRANRAAAGALASLKRAAAL